MDENGPPAAAILPHQLRRLSWNERVRRGDFVKTGRQGFELWEGPAGFRAGSFVKTIYRKVAPHPAAAGVIL